MSAIAAALGQHLNREVHRLGDRHPRPRLERLSGVHNPWGPAASLTDAWAWLDACEEDDVLDAVQRCIGPDIILWDSQLYFNARDYLRFLAEEREGRYWPVEPLQGALIWLARQQEGAFTHHCVPLERVAALGEELIDPDAWLYVARYMPAASRFVRTPSFRAHRLAMEEQLLINHAQRPLWLVRGSNLAGNDLVTGFAPVVPQWARHHNLEN